MKRVFLVSLLAGAASLLYGASQFIGVDTNQAATINGVAGNASVLGMALDAAGGGGGGPSVGATVTYIQDSASPFADMSHTLDSGSDYLVVVVNGYTGVGGVDIDRGSRGQTSIFDGATWTATGTSGQAMTVLVPVDTSYPTAETTAIYVLQSPNVGSAAGAGFISFTPDSHTTVGSGLHFVAVNVKGVAALRAHLDSSVSSVNTTASVDVTSAATDLVVSFKASDDDTVTDESGATNVYARQVFNNQYFAVQTNTGASPTKTISMTTADYPLVWSLSFEAE